MNQLHPVAAFDTLTRIGERSTAAILGWSALRSQALRNHLLAEMPATGHPHALLSEPVVEAAHGWATAPETFGSLAGSLLSPSVVDALDGGREPDPEGRDRYRLPRNRHPYTHQLEAWRRLLDPAPRSVLVTSGTGSGKTECFLVPLLEHLARDVQARGGPLRGVQALMLYPLNALINSQRERLSDWTRPFKGGVRFCLYNGETEKQLPVAEQERTPEEVRSRHLLRRDPPPILVTNITMLEYMLIRREDRPILERSQGKLRYIILDEAHSYIGSQAAELSLLLRRVMRAFGVLPEQVRFVATSATIGRSNDPATREALGAFLADVAGVPRGAVDVIEGNRRPPDLPPPQAGLALPPIEELREGDPTQLFDRLARTPAFRRGFDSLVSSPRTAAQWCDAVGAEPAHGAALLAAAARARTIGADGAPQALQPLKVHGFHRSQGGLWACADAACPGRAGTPLDAPDWGFGPVFPERLDRCPRCTGPTFEAVFCSICGETALDALRAPDAEGMERIAARVAAPAEDEFLSELLEDTAEAEDEASSQTIDPYAVLVAAPGSASARPAPVVRETGTILEAPSADALTLALGDPRQCPHCRVPFDGRRSRLVNFRVGAPFLLGGIVPELVSDASPLTPTRQNPGPLPADGRQILTFTDSRQGTARLAAKLQSEAERNHVRMLLYQAVQERPAVTDDMRREMEAKQAELREIDAAMRDSPKFASALAAGRTSIEREIARLQPSEKRVAWSDALSLIAKDEICRRWIKDEIWAEREAAFTGDEAFARFLLLRELIRPPARANSVETMGLVRLSFGHIEERVTTAPEAFTRHGGTLADWRDFLNLAVSRVFRSNFAVDADRTTLHWIAPGIPRRYVVPPDGRTYGDVKLRAWPQLSLTTSRRPIVVALLAAGLQLDLDNPVHRDDLMACMEAAWLAIQPLLKADSVSGTQLDPRAFALAPVRQAFLCPVNRRIVGRAFRGLSPNPRAPGDVFVPAEPIALPDFPFAFGRSGAGTAERSDIEVWLKEDAQVAALRARGHWSDLHDRIARRDTFYRSAEHSAQQPGRTLRGYERDFRRGRINVLNCSTTMEMGVDIGSIGTVLMTNVPPSAASYRQRVGRAGRRGQALALSLTLCKHRPTELSAFRNPLSLLTRAVAAPSVSLDSAVIAQRHVNALMLARYLDETGAELPKLEAGYFYGLHADGSRAPDGESPAERFITWVDAPSTRSDPRLRSDLQVLVRRTPLEGREPVALDATRDGLAALRAAFEQEWDVLRADLAVAEKERAAAHTALAVAMRRLANEYLLTELAARGFLPAHGFPTDVVPFDTSNAHIRERRHSDDEKEVARPARYRDAPSRQLDLAIRDYAPGSEIVLDGIVYQSAGVRLDWKRPASETSVPDIQALRVAWRCERCGATDTAYRAPEGCPSCGEAGRSLRWHRYLRPSGFSCDPVTKPHAEIERVAYVPPRLPWVAARSGIWTSFPDPTAGRFRASRNGMVFHYTAGTGEHGYAICLCCGRAEPETASRDANPPLPGPLARHRPLRTGRKEQPVCEAQERPFAIQRHHFLGHETITDVLEVQLAGLPGPDVGYPIAAALRDALAQTLGVEPGEIGVAVTQTREAEGAERRWSIFLFDRAAGGAGFSVAAAPRLAELLDEARAILRCPHGEQCRHGCADCILSRDLEHQAIDRLGALAYLDGTVLPRLAIPAQDRLFGPHDTRAEMQPLADAIMREMERPGSSLTLWISGSPRDWDFARWSALDVVRRLALRGCPVEIVVPAPALAGAGPDLRLALFGLMKAGATIRQAAAAPIIGTGTVLARVGSEAQGIVWATRGTGASLPGPTWGTAPDGAIVRGARAGALDRGVLLDLEGVLRPSPDTVFVEIGADLDGPVAGFGAGFWRLLAGRVPALAARIRDRDALAELHYSDRYLLAPLPLRLIREVLAHAPGRGRETQLRLDTAALDSRRHPSAPFAIDHDWSLDAHGEQVTRLLLAGLAPGAVLNRADRRDLPHGRSLVLRYTDGRGLRVVLDQGVGYWRPDRRGQRFDFAQPPGKQATSLDALQFSIRASSPNPTWIVVTQSDLNR